MSALLRPPASNVEPSPVYRLTVDQYHAMIRAGILEEGAPYELLDGLVVRKDRAAAGGSRMTVGEGHIYCVQALALHLLGQTVERGGHLRVQQPLSLPPDDEPEPDAAIVRGDHKAYRDRKPGPDDTLSVMEVSGSSLELDRATKLKLYARAGVPQYVILNLAERVAEVYIQPRPEAGRYATMHTLGAGATLRMPAPQGEVAVQVAELLP